MAAARSGFDSVNPGIPLGLMSIEAPYSGYPDAEWLDATTRGGEVAAMLRPGGGFWNDDAPSALLGKAHSVGRQNAFLAGPARDIQYEHENFPYLPFAKSDTLFVAELAAAAAAGCTGAVLNFLDIVGNPFEEYVDRFEALRDARQFLDAVAAACGGRPCRGLWQAFGKEHVAALGLDAAWPNEGGKWGLDLQAMNELFTLGLPPAYAREGACATILCGDGVNEWSDEELDHYLSGGVLLDGQALSRLEERGLGGLTGWRIAGTREVDTLQRFTADPINGRFAGWRRDARPTFHTFTTFLIEPLDPAARALAVAEDFTIAELGVCEGVFENRLGGRVAVLGYSPWRVLGSLAKTSQLRALARWVSRETLPAWIDSFHRMAVWSHRDTDGHPVHLVINASIDTARDVILAGSDMPKTCEALAPDGTTHALTPRRSECETVLRVTLPTMAAWSALLVRGEGGGSG